MRNKRKRETKAQPLGYVSLFAGIVVSAAVWIVLQAPISMIRGRRDNATAAIEDETRRQAAEKGAELFGTISGNLLLWTTFIGVFGLIAYTVYLRRGGR